MTVTFFTTYILLTLKIMDLKIMILASGFSRRYDSDVIDTVYVKHDHVAYSTKVMEYIYMSSTTMTMVREILMISLTTVQDGLPSLSMSNINIDDFCFGCC